MQELNSTQYDIDERRDKLLGNQEHWFLKLLPVIPTKYIISYKNPTKSVWDVIVLFLAVWNAFFMPLDYAFNIELSPFVKVFDNLVDFLFFGDIMLMFITSY